MQAGAGTEQGAHEPKKHPPTPICTKEKLGAGRNKIAQPLGAGKQDPGLR